MKLLASASGAVKAPEGTVWIGGAHPFDLHESYLNFRADLKLASVPTTATFQLSADSRYRLWINGSFVGRGPERSWPSSMAVDAHSIVHLMRSGLNRIAVQVYSPGYSHFAYVHRGAAGLIGWLMADGQTVLKTGPGWKVSRDLSWSDRVNRVSIYGTGVEDRDMRRAEDWTQAEPQSMDEARVVQGPEGRIWQCLRPRMTALPVEDQRTLDQPWQVRTGPTVTATGDPHQDLRDLFAVTQPGNPPALLPRGTAAIWIFDLGESRTCLAGAAITASGGERLLISYAEKLRDGELLLSDPATYCRMRPTDRFTLRSGRQSVEGFTPRGARYVVFALEGGGTAADPRFFLRLPTSPIPTRPPPALHDPTLGAVAALCRRTTLACLQDGFVDGVWRESSLWLGDAVAQDWALRAISDDPRPLLFTLAMAAEGADAEGLLPSVLPGEIPAYAVIDYNFAWVELLAAAATHPGIPDATQLWQQHWPTLVRMLARMATLRQPHGLLRTPPGRRLFLDWSAMDRTEPNLTLNLRCLYVLQLAAQMADRIGAGDGATWKAEAEALTQSLAVLNRPEGWQESPRGAGLSQLGLAFLILTGLVEGKAATDLADRIVGCSLGVTQGLTLASPFMHHTIFQALDKLGRHGDIRAIIAALWGLWARSGDANTRENWSIDFPDGSACHGFSAHPLGWLTHLKT